MTTVVTANIGNHRARVTLAHQVAALRWIVRQCDPDVVALQEVKPGLRYATRRHRLIRFPGRGATHNGAFLVRRSLNIVGSGAVRAHDSNGHYPPKWVTWLDLEDFGPVLNLHVNSGIESRGRPRPGVNRGRLDDALLHIWLASRWANFLNAGAICGDFNVHADADRRERFYGFPAARMARHAFVDAHHDPTLGWRSVDRIFVPQDMPARARVLGRRKPFDHRFAVVELGGAAAT